MPDDDLETCFKHVTAVTEPDLTPFDSRPFDEASYLQFNPDIAEAVGKGEYLSGFQHYVRFGHSEGRAFRTPDENARNQVVFTDSSGITVESAAPRSEVEMLLIAPHGIFLNGWAADAESPIERLHVRGGGWSFWVTPGMLARIRRMDVEGALGLTATHPNGFWSFIATEQRPLASLCGVTVFFEGGRASVFAVTPMTASDEGLREVALGYLAGSQHFGNSHVSGILTVAGGIGQQLVTFNKGISRTAVAGAHVERFHVRGTSPKASIVVCLYGKAEFLFLQACLFHRCDGIEEYEFIYVSNSPEIIERMLAEARIASRVYGIDITCVLLTGNAGFGAANNVAAQHARSGRIVIMNPDVFPRDRRWGRQHAALLDQAAPEQTRIFGVPLYYDDGSLMHGGMYFDIDRPLTLTGGELAPRRLVRVEHYGKGAPADDAVFTRSRPVAAVTGAFISVERSWFEQLGGFNEDYIFGHYEDADLCLKSGAGGVAPWLQDVRLWHLEGKGSTRLPVHEGGSLVNRWLFSERWADYIEANYTLGPDAVRLAMQDATRATGGG